MRKSQTTFSRYPPACPLRRWPPLAGGDGGSPAPRSCLPQWLTARRSAAWRGLDMALEIDETHASGVHRGEGLGSILLTKICRFLFRPCHHRVEKKCTVKNFGWPQVADAVIEALT
jgi:hypothetical protein